MLEKRSHYTIQEVCSELRRRGASEQALLTYLQDGQLKAYVEFPPYLAENKAELSREFWAQWTLDEVRLCPPRPGGREDKQWRAPVALLKAQEITRLKTIARAVAKRDLSVIDPALRVVVDASENRGNRDSDEWYVNSRAIVTP